MKEFIDKLISRLEEESDFFSGEPMGSLQKAFYCKGVEKSISIVNQLAEEYNNESVKDDLISRQDVFRMIEKQQDIARGDGGTLMSLALLKGGIERISAPYERNNKNE